MGISDLFDRVNTLERENDRLREIMSTMREDDRPSLLLTRYAKEKLLEQCFYQTPSTSSVNLRREDGGYTFRNFEDWCEYVTYDSNIPPYMSRDEVVIMVRDELHRKYEECQQRAIEEYERGH